MIAFPLQSDSEQFSFHSHKRKRGIKVIIWSEIFAQKFQRCRKLLRAISYKRELMGCDQGLRRTILPSPGGTKAVPSATYTTPLGPTATPPVKDSVAPVREM